MQTVGVFGGTFDPPHLAHLILASEALDQLHIDKILWVLTPLPPHKPDQLFTSLAIRKDMVLAAINGNPGFEFSSIDIDRDPPYYAVDTVSLLRKKYADTRIVYLIGADSLRDLPKWHNPAQLIDHCDAFGVMDRPKVRVNLELLHSQFPGIYDKIRYVRAPLVEISSSDIRQRINQGKPYRYFLPEKVFDLIVKHNLYQH